MLHLGFSGLDGLFQLGIVSQPKLDQLLFQASSFILLGPRVSLMLNGEGFFLA
jgi:hypothetical protein